MSTCRRVRAGRSADLLEDDRDGVGDLGRDQAAIADGCFHPGERMKQRAGDGGVERVERHR